ncbi:MAG TPA: type II secretion system F family protein [Candidatus Paceibacterota bacterium]|nr:type II secretion system F family protein [Candidatus Paceibacterota bacterium]
MKFNYQVRTKTGEIRAGQVEASSKEGAINLLQKYGLYVTFLEEAVQPFYATRIKLFEKISQKDVVLFSRQLSIMFRSKVPLVESLRVLSSQSQSFEFKEKILKISDDVEGGSSFSGALSNYPNIFSSFYIAMIKSGEVSGKLSEVLDYLAEHLEREYHLLGRVKGAMLYPLLVLFVVFLILALLVFFVIPHLSEVLEASGEALPLITQIIIAIAEFFRQFGLAILLIFVFLVIFGLRYYRTEKGRRFFDNILLKLPLFSPLFKMIFINRFAENLSTLISGGLPIAQALEIVADIIDNTLYKEVILKTRDEVRKGEAISEILSKSPELFSPVFVQMVLVGERTGSLDTTLMSIVDFYQKEIDRTIENTLSILEPALIVFLGVVVAGLMLSILVPMYKMVSL